jgi:hypothetical protein
MSAKKYDVVAVTGKYTDSNGEEKSRYMNIGAVIQTKNGFMLKLEGVPVGWDGWAYLNEPQAKEQKPASKGQQRRGNSDFDDGPPF